MVMARKWRGDGAWLMKDQSQNIHQRKDMNRERLAVRKADVPEVRKSDVSEAEVCATKGKCRADVAVRESEESAARGPDSSRVRQAIGAEESDSARDRQLESQTQRGTEADGHLELWSTDSYSGGIMFEVDTAELAQGEGEKTTKKRKMCPMIVGRNPW